VKCFHKQEGRETQRERDRQTKVRSEEKKREEKIRIDLHGRII
jgi:hypothetical protein